jgi:hypothetical protein
MREDDNNWPQPDRVGKQELEIKMAGEHICFNTTKLGSVLQVQQSKDPDGLRIFYYLVQVSSGCVWKGLLKAGQGSACRAGAGALETSWGEGGMGGTVGAGVAVRRAVGQRAKGGFVCIPHHLQVLND